MTITSAVSTYVFNIDVISYNKIHVQEKASMTVTKTLNHVIAKFFAPINVLTYLPLKLMTTYQLVVA